MGKNDSPETLTQFQRQFYPMAAVNYALVIVVNVSGKNYKNYTQNKRMIS